MMRILVALTLLLFLAGCGSKNIRITGMICPEGHTEQMIDRDMRECRAYDEAAAEKASQPKLTTECIECLKQRGYEIE